MTDDFQQDALTRINGWLEQLEGQALALLTRFSAEELAPMQAVQLATKVIALMTRLLEVRQQFTGSSLSDEERILKIIFGDAPERYFIDSARPLNYTGDTATGDDPG